MNEAELQALAAIHGGEAGRRKDPRTEKREKVYTDPATGAQLPTGFEELNTEPDWIIEFNNGRRAVVRPRAADPSQYDVIDMPAPPSGATARGTEGGAPYIVGGQRFDPGTNTFIDIPGYRGPASAQGSWQNGIYYGPPGADIPEALYADPNAIAERQERAAAARATADRLAEAERRQTIETQLRVIEAGRQANEYDDKHAQALRDWVYKTQVELPQKLGEQEDVLRSNAITRGQTAGAAAVSDITATLPYRYSPGFQARQQAVQAEAARGNFQPGITQSIARSYRGPDLAGARQAAESRYENDYLHRFGFDPVATAQGVPYRLPGPTAAPIAGVADDEEQLKRLAAQLAGN